MIRQPFVLLSGIILLLGGCNMAPQYARTEAPIPADWPNGPAYESNQFSQDTPVATELAWQDFFHDAKLQQIIETALENNRDLRLAAHNVEQARALYGVQRAELLPSLSAIAAGSKQRSSSDLTPFGQPRTTEVYDINLGVISWEVDFFGRIRSLEEQAMQEYLATEQARRSAQIALVSQVASVYLAIAADQANLNLACSTLETQQGVYDLIRQQYEVELANKIDLRRAQTQVDVARGDVARYTQLVAQGRNALNLLAGTEVSEDLLASDLANVEPFQDISLGLPSEVLFCRPDIMAAEHQLKGAYAFVGAARAAFFPRISLTTAIGTASDELSGLFSGGNGTWRFAPQIVAPIFDARTWAAYKVSKSTQELALTQYEKAIQTAFKEVADVLAVRGTVNQQVSAQQSVVDASGQIYSLANTRYTNGIDSYLSVLDAQRSLYAAQQALTFLELAKFTNQVTFYAVLGGGGERAEATAYALDGGEGGGVGASESGEGVSDGNAGDVF